MNQPRHNFKIKVYPGDTDAYGVVWHGAYIKWLEAGRVELLEQTGISFPELDKMGIVMPVVEIDIRYKHFSRPYDELCIMTCIEEFNKMDIVFQQEITNVKTDRIVLTARVKGVTTSTEGKLFREIPEYLRNRYDILIKN